MENLYDRSLYELSTNINDIEVDISKLVATNNVSSQRQILDELYQNCILAENNLSCLPISANNSNKLNSFINQLGGYTCSLLDKVNKGTAISDEEFETILTLNDQSEVMVYQINMYVANQDYDFSMLNKINFENYDNDYLSEIGEIMGTSTDIPTLIYDGPFSDSVTNKMIKGLPEVEVTSSDGLQKITNLLPEYQNVTCSGTTSNKFNVFNYTAEYNGVSYYIQITQTGGLFLSISATSETDGENYTIRQCEDIAEAFSQQLGISEICIVFGVPLAVVLRA